MNLFKAIKAQAAVLAAAVREMSSGFIRPMRHSRAAAPVLVNESQAGYRVRRPRPVKVKRVTGGYSGSARQRRALRRIAERAAKLAVV
jgi:hypothetical protein